MNIFIKFLPVLIFSFTCKSATATIIQVSKGTTPSGQQIIVLGLAHWEDDVESFKQATLLTAFAKKHPTATFLLEDNSEYEKLKPQGEDSEPRQASFPHYSYQYQAGQLQNKVVSMATSRGYGLKNAEKALRALSLYTYSTHRKYICPVTLFQDAVKLIHGFNPHLVGIDPRKRLVAVNGLLNVIRKNPYLHLETLVPLVGLDENYLESFTFTTLLNEIKFFDEVLRRAVINAINANNNDLAQLFAALCWKNSENLRNLEEFLSELEESVCVAFDLSRNEFNIDDTAVLVFIDRLTKANRKNCSGFGNITQLQEKLSNAFDLIMTFACYAQTMKTIVKNQETLDPIVVIAGADHTRILETLLETHGIRFGRTQRRCRLTPHEGTRLLRLRVEH